MLFFACGNSPANKSTVLSNLETISEDEGYLDIPFTIVDSKFINGYKQNKVQAIHQNDTLELLISLKKDIPAGFVNGVPKNMFVNEGVIFESTGERSDKLLTSLSEKYGLDNGSIAIKQTQRFACANLNQTPVDYNTGTPKFKIFLESENDYAELFLNFDFSKGLIFLNEKDPEYRNSLITLLKK